LQALARADKLVMKTDGMAIGKHRKKLLKSLY
jgi:hypothetical protein